MYVRIRVTTYEYAYFYIYRSLTSKSATPKIKFPRKEKKLFFH